MTDFSFSVLKFAPVFTTNGFESYLHAYYRIFNVACFFWVWVVAFYSRDIAPWLLSIWFTFCQTFMLIWWQITGSMIQDANEFCVQDKFWTGLCNIVFPQAQTFYAYALLSYVIGTRLLWAYKEMFWKKLIITVVISVLITVATAMWEFSRPIFIVVSATVGFFLTFFALLVIRAIGGQEIEGFLQLRIVKCFGPQKNEVMVDRRS